MSSRSIKMILEFALGCGICLVLVMLAPLTLWQDLGRAGATLLSVAAAMALTVVVLFRHRQSGRGAAMTHEMKLGPVE